MWGEHARRAGRGQGRTPKLSSCILGGALGATTANKSSRTWVLRAVVWFATVYTIVILIHEAAHAAAAVLQGIPATLFNFWVNNDFSRATMGQRAVAGIAGPTASLLVGVVSWWIYRRVKDSAAGLPLLYLAAFGVMGFFGNLMSTAFIGDFSAAAVRLNVPPMARYAASATGLVAMAAIMFATGRELRQRMPGEGRMAAVLGGIVVPAAVGTAIVIVINQPTVMGSSFAPARATEALFWLFGVLGAVIAKPSQTVDSVRLALRWIDVAVAAGAVLAVKAAAQGILLTP